MARSGFAWARVVSLGLTILVAGCTVGGAHNTSSDSDPGTRVASGLRDPNQSYPQYQPGATDVVINRVEYLNKLHGFWLGQCIGNWTGLVTEMDKVGNIGEFQTGAFYTRDDWGQPDQPSIWGQGTPSALSPTIDFVYEDEDGIWGSDDDTDIEYIYQHLLYQNRTSMLTGEQIRAGWLTHIYSDANTPYKDAEGNPENFLWVANQRAHDLMREGLVPPATGAPEHNAHWDMIDAQLTTEIFGLFAPARPDIAIQMAELPIRTVARGDAQWAAEFYIVMHSLAAIVDPDLSPGEQVRWLAQAARQRLPDQSYSAKMYDFVKSEYDKGTSWESVRDSLYEKYQVNQEDGYDITARGLYCNGCFASGINFAAGLVSLLYGEGNIIETIRIGTLAGWDSDNPTATWGGLIGFMLGRDGIESAFGRTFANQFNIHRTRRGFPDDGLVTFEEMARTGVFIVDRVVQEQMGGGIDLDQNLWYIPGTGESIAAGR